MARTRAAGYDDQRERILARAAALFAQRGFQGSSMNELAAACGLSKAALYHYFRDKDTLLLEIAEGHVSQLLAATQAVVASSAGRPPQARLQSLIECIVHEYADSQNAHRVLTEDVRFLAEGDQRRVLDQQRRLVDLFAAAVAAVRPDADAARLVKPLTMLLFGMVNWMFTWHRGDGPLTHEALAPLVAGLFTAGVTAVDLPPARAAEGTPPPPVGSTPAPSAVQRRRASSLATALTLTPGDNP